jgi:DNA-binding NtrC family response regulator
MSKERGRIVVIEDEPSVSDALKLIFEDQGYDVDSAAKGRDGIELARRSPTLLTITDLSLPDISGLKVLDAIRRENPHSIVIIITAQGTPEVFAEARKRGAAEILSKPFLPAEIIQLVNDVLAHRESGGS